MQQLPLAMRPHDHASFGNFAVAAAPEAVAHLRRIAAGERGVIWLHGGTAVGKSHLLQAVCAATSATERAGYFPLREWLQQHNSSDAAVLQGWQLLDRVCIDDVQLVVGNMAWERALFSLYREIDERRASLVLAAGAPPALLPWALADLGSRLAASSVYRLRELSDAEQAQALRQRALLRGLELPEETLIYLQQRFPRDMRSLCALLDRLDEASLVHQRRITLPFMREVLGDSA